MVEAAFKADHQAALLGVEAAQRAGRLDHHPGIGEFPQNGIPKLTGNVLGKAVGNAQQCAVIEASALHFLHHIGDGLSVPPNLSHQGQAAALDVTDHPNAQHPCQLGRCGADPTVSGQVGQRLEPIHGVGVVMVIPCLLHNGIKVTALTDQLGHLLHQHGLLRAGSQGVKDIAPLAGVLLQVLRQGLLCGVVAAGDVLGNGDAEDNVCPFKGFQPVANVGAGGTGGSMMMLQVVNHTGHVQAGGVHIFFGSGNDLHGYGGVVHAGQSKQIG